MGKGEEKAKRPRLEFEIPAAADGVHDAKEDGGEGGEAWGVKRVPES